MSKQNSLSTPQTQTWVFFLPPNLGASLSLPSLMSPSHLPGVVSILSCQYHWHLPSLPAPLSVRIQDQSPCTHLAISPYSTLPTTHPLQPLDSPLFKPTFTSPPVPVIKLLSLSLNYSHLCPAWRFWS